MKTYKVNLTKKRACLKAMRKYGEKYRALNMINRWFIPLCIIVAVAVTGVRAATGRIYDMIYNIVVWVIILLVGKMFFSLMSLAATSAGFADRVNESVTLTDLGIVYSNHSMQSNNITRIISTEVLFSNIHYVEYNRRTGELLIHDSHVVSVYDNGKLTDTIKGTEMPLINYFDCDLIEIFKKANVQIKEKN